MKNETDPKSCDMCLVNKAKMFYPLTRPVFWGLIFKDRHYYDLIIEILEILQMPMLCKCYAMIILSNAKGLTLGTLSSSSSASASSAAT